jgi:AbrB family looped-hinge helix DNA binding protein
MNGPVSKVKIAEQLMTRPEGATMEEILAATGGSWQYNVKPRLEARGYTIKKRKEGRRNRYFAEAPEGTTYEAALTSKGQVTIPKEVREQLGLHTGQKVRFKVEDNSRATMEKAGHSILDFVGILPKPKRAATLEEMDEAIARGAVERYLRSKR